MKRYKGITLVALIITVIILIILATVTISEVNGNGIISHAQKAKKDAIIMSEKESLSISVLDSKRKGNVDYSKLDGNIDRNIFEGSNGTYTSKESGNRYYIDEDGNVSLEE